MSGSMSGRWRRGMVQLMGHRQTKGPVTVRQHLNYRATSRLHFPQLSIVNKRSYYKSVPSNLLLALHLE